MKHLILLSLIVGLLVINSPVYANININVDKKVDRMKKELNLNDTQANSVKAALEDYKNKVREAAKEKDDRFSKVLNPQQMTQLKQMWDRDKMDEDNDNDADIKANKGKY
jgi:hypothetical protein